MTVDFSGRERIRCYYGKPLRREAGKLRVIALLRNQSLNGYRAGARACINKQTVAAYIYRLSDAVNVPRVVRMLDIFKFTRTRPRRR